MATTTSGSAAATSPHVRRREPAPGRFRTSSPPAAAIISGTQWPPAKGGSSHPSAATRGPGPPSTVAATRASRRGGPREPAVEAGQERLGRRPAAGRRADAADVGEDVGERARVEREEVRAAGERAERAVHLLRRDGADRAEALGDDEVGSEVRDP